jgi:predicted deacylase
VDVLTIGNEKIKRGSNVLVEFDVARLPSGTSIHLPIHVFRSKHDGPVLLLSGGLHGDEVNGIETVRRLVESNIFNRLLCGSVIAMPIINIYGFLNFSRDVPDGKDVNRSFPGNPDGSLASYVAYIFTNNILPAADLGIDFHTGGASRTNYPQIRYAKEDQRAAEIAEAFAAPFTLHSSIIDGSLRAQAAKMGKSILVYEGGESLRFDEFAIAEAIKGVERVMAYLGMIRKVYKPKPTRLFRSSQWVRAELSGLLRLHKYSGERVQKGEVLGVVSGPASRYEAPVEAPADGYIIGHNNIPVIHKGDALFHIGTN